MKCYFFGTFNPPHFGHIELAKKAKFEFGFSRIVFVPAFCPPHKETIDFIHRFNMLKLAIGEDWGEVSDIESRLKTPSYTFQTVEYLLKVENIDKYGVWGGKIPFIIGYDAFFGIEKWKNPEILKKNLFFIVLKRRGEADYKDIMAFRDRGFDFKIVKNAGCYDVSSCQIRENVRQGKSISAFTDKKVEGYIYEHKLYWEYK